MAPYRALYLKGARRLGLMFIYQFKLEISREKAQELRELLEDTIQYFCDNEQVSGELAWTITECLAIAKQAELVLLLLIDGKTIIQASKTLSIA